MRAEIAASIALIVSLAPTTTCPSKGELDPKCEVVEISPRTSMLVLQWGVLP